MEVSAHARERWSRRFPGRDMDVEYARATVRVGRKLRRLIRQSCPHHVAHTKPSFRGRYYLATPDGIVFVMARLRPS